MQIKQSAIFNFSHQVGPTNYNFSIPAESKEEACRILLKAFEVIGEELQKELKPATKAN